MQVSDTNKIRFSGIDKLFGPQSLEKLWKSHVCVVGLGGVGSWVCESLCRSGIGELTLIDLDEICQTNTNRQIHTLNTTIGQSKSQIMAKRLKEISPEIKINCIEDFLGSHNIHSYLNSEIDITIDAIDSVNVKACMIDYSLKNNRPLLTIGATGGKKETTQISFGDLGETRGDVLLMRVKKVLKREYSYPKGEQLFGIKAIYSPEKIRFFDNDGNQVFKGPRGHVKLDCHSGLGSASFLTGSFGLTAAQKTIEYLLGHR